MNDTATIRGVKTLFDQAAHESIRSRVSALRGDEAPRWGRMSAAQMVCHVTDVLHIALGEVPIVRMGSFPLTLLTLYPFRWLFAYRLPWPKGMPTAPEMQRSKPAAWEADVKALLSALDRFAEPGKDSKAAWGTHPLLGPLPGWEWGPLVYKHLDHHLTQFGV